MKITLKKKGFIAQVAFFFEGGRVREMSFPRLIFKKFLPNIIAIPLFYVLLGITYIAGWTLEGMAWTEDVVVKATNIVFPKAVFK